MVGKAALPAFVTTSVTGSSRPLRDDASATSEMQSSPSHPAMPADAPTNIAKRYKVTELVGRGGTAEIFAVEDEASGRRLALKRLRHSAANDETTVRLFEREYHTLAGLRHPRIIRVHDYGVDGSPFYTMDLVEGRDLREMAPLPYREACRHLRDIASSLALLHTRRLLYRDLSPRNARVDAHGSCRLIDFGALIPVGTAGELVGTPPSVSPEAFHRLPLDQRSDLYALGAVAYFLLSGRHAYAVKSFEELPKAWTRLPRRLSSVAQDIPASLDDLVLSLLSLDRLERPAHAADVIDSLSVIAELEPETDTQVAQAYLLSPRLTGRKSELGELTTRLNRALRRSGASIWLEGSGGVGKTRLVSELQLIAKLRGALAVRIDAEARRGPFSTAEALALALFDEAPRLASTVAAPYASILAQLSRSMQERLGGVATEPSSPPGECRAGIQSALSEWLLALANQQPLVAIIENVQWTDQASAALLLSLVQAAPQTPLLIVLTHRSGEIGVASDTLERLKQRSSTLALSPLAAAEVTALVQSLFGSVAYTHRFAEWMARQTGGNPFYCLELARHAVEQGIARYEQGTWVLPEELPKQELQVRYDDAFLFTLAILSASALSLAETLSAYHGAIPLSLCLSIADDPDPRSVYASLNELVERDVLISRNDTYHFRQGALRQRIFKRLEGERKAAIHRRLGEAMLATTDAGSQMQLEAGWHLLQSGEELRGAEILAGIVDKTRSFRRFELDLSAALPALEASFEVFRQRGRGALEQASLLVALVEAGYYANRSTAQRYGDQAIEHLRQLTGLELAARLQPLLGRHVSLRVGLIVARVRFALLSGDRSERAFEELLTTLLTSVTYLCGIASLCLDPETAMRYARVLEPLTALGKRQVPSGIYDYCLRLTQIVMDRFEEASTGILRLIAQLSDPNGYQRLADEPRRLLLGGAWYALGVLESFRDTDAVLRCAEQLDSLGLHFYEMIADRLRASYHLYRGEEERAQEYRDRLDVYASQTGSTWQIEVWGAATSITAYYRVNDPLGVKQCAERLEKLSAEIPSLAWHARTAHAIYHLLRGDPRLAIELGDIPEHRYPRAHVGWVPMQGVLAHAHNADGNYRQARLICRQALEQLSLVDRDFIVMTLDIEIQLALAEAGLGAIDTATEQLDALLQRYEEDRGPITRARLYEARARVAAFASDDPKVTLYLDKMEAAARSTHNSSMLALWRRLVRQLRPDPMASIAPERVTLEQFQPWRTTFIEMRHALPCRGRELEEEFTATESRIDP